MSDCKVMSQVIELVTQICEFKTGRILRKIKSHESKAEQK